MLKSVFTIIIAIHGLIHLLGFVKAFDIANITQFSILISKPLGLAWLVAGILFLVTAVLYISSFRLWLFFAIIAMILSQIMIFTAWGDAKFGTVANLIILLVALPAMGDWFFNSKVKSEQQSLLEQVSDHEGERVREEDLQRLPGIVQTWLRNSAVVGRPEISFVRLKQAGKMKTDPDGRWMNFSAIQYFDAQNPSFVWKVDVDLMPMITLTGRDKLQNGEGEMVIKLLSLVNVVNEKGNDQINTGTMVRFLGEICWFPSAALNENITWEEVDKYSAKAALEIGGRQVTGLFRFHENGDLLSFEADRYYGGGKEAVKHRWVVETGNYSTFDGYRVPGKSTVTWKLPEGDFTWLHLEISHLEMNRYELYQ